MFLSFLGAVYSKTVIEIYMIGEKDTLLDVMTNNMMQVYVTLIVEMDTPELVLYVGKIALQDFQIQELIV